MIPGLVIRYSVTIDTSGAVAPFGERRKPRSVRCGYCDEPGHRAPECTAMYDK